jgi:V8-like Glu-specific endopeptidase
MSEYHERLLARANRAFQDKPISEFTKRVRAIIGPAAGQVQEQFAQEALAALSNDERPTPKQLAALELVIRTMRPAPLSRNGELETLDPDVAPCFKDWESFRANVKPFIYSIGRVDLAPDKGVGTGFLVSETLFVTNKHVLDVLSNGTNVLEKGQAFVRFKEEYKSPTEDPVDIVGVAAIHPKLDAALLRIEEKKFDDGRLPLTIESEAAESGQAIVAVGYPFEDKIRNPMFVSALFGDRFGVKRAAPGEVVGAEEQAIFHDCSTLGGNSGSPILSMDKARVVGLHRDGFFTYRNEAVDGKSLSDFVSQHL